ncbi:MAG: peroxiredoxin family protein [Candidatus Eisenbacteria bacterium]|nr:peroxiredoxin family protein [Candidatus Eisenbacteria bacterium]
MPRIAFVLALLLAAAPAAAQTDRYRPAQPPTDKRAAAGGIPSSPRLSLGSVEKGDRAPDFDLPLAGGGKVRLSNLRGQWAVVCFCPRRALGSLDSLARAVPEQTVVLGVVAEKVSQLAAWAARRDTKALLLDDMTGDIAALYGAYDMSRNQPLPGYVIVDPKGVVVRIEIREGLVPSDAARAVQYAVTGL